VQRACPLAPPQAMAHPQEDRSPQDRKEVMHLTVTIPIVAVAAIVAYLCYRFLGLRLWHLLVCLILGFLLAATSYAPEIQTLLNAILHGGHK
jgi:F0F1-type ATP synthase assembly protein I